MKTYVGIDLHSTNSYFAVVNDNGDRLFHRRISNNKDSIMDALERIQKFGEISSLAVESTYNWYWLVDLLIDHDLNVKLANPSQIKQYEGIKHTNDKSDAYFLADLLRLNILPSGWICPKSERSVRDLLRTRLQLVQKRTSFKNSLSSIIARHTGSKVASSKILDMPINEISNLVNDSFVLLRIGHLKAQVFSLDHAIKMIEKKSLKTLQLKREYQALLSVPGIGPVLAMTIMVETGDIKRFPKSGNYTSYCRCVDSRRTSNGKNKGKNNRKNGSRYLSWAYSEAAMNLKRYCTSANRYWQRKKAKGPVMLANKSLAAKLTKACYYMIRDNTEFDTKKLFGYEDETLGALSMHTSD